MHLAIEHSDSFAFGAVNLPCSRKAADGSVRRVLWICYPALADAASRTMMSALADFSERFSRRQVFDLHSSDPYSIIDQLIS